LHPCHKKAKGVAKVAAARKLAIRLNWMLRTNIARQSFSEGGSPATCDVQTFGHLELATSCKFFSFNIDGRPASVANKGLS
jgi:hypothetical protein